MEFFRTKKTFSNVHKPLIQRWLLLNVRK
jgi:hypothetical protein